LSCLQFFPAHPPMDRICLHSWLDEVKRRDALDERTRHLLEAGIKPLLTSLNYRDFADKLLKWAEELQSGAQQDQSAFDEFEEEREVWKQILSEITKKFQGEDVSLHQLLHELDLTSKTPPKPPEAIPCFTIHASKGLEFGHVYLMGLVEDQLPSWAAVKKGPNSLEMQEETSELFRGDHTSSGKLNIDFFVESVWVAKTAFKIPC